MTIKFLNSYEEVTYSKIKEITERDGAHVFAKVRLADILPINNSGISNQEYRFALQSHVDFLVTDAAYLPLFTVEFDGPTHFEQKQIERDNTKNSLLKKFSHPFIRINSRYLESKYRGLDLLTYFIDCWFLGEGFDRAQESGQIPYDELFDPTFIFSNGRNESQTWPYWLSLEVQVKIRKLYENKKIAQMSPCHWVGEDEFGNLRCFSWLFITEESCVLVETGMKDHFFPYVWNSDLISQLSTFEIYENLIKILGGKQKPRLFSDYLAIYDFYERKYTMRFFSSCNTRKKD